MTSGAAFLMLDATSCAKHRLEGGLSKLKPCRLDGIKEELFCGKLTVFENRQTRTGRTIDLNVVVLPALDQKAKAEPLFDLAGGPGVASTGAAMILRERREKNTTGGTTLCVWINAAPVNQIASRLSGRRRRSIT